MDKLIKYFLVCLAAVLVGNTLMKIVDYKFNHLKQESEQIKPTSTITLEKRQQQLDCLARNIYYEAAKEPFEGKVAVAQVTLNRTESGKFPTDVCKVIYQKNVFMEKVVCQFSWYCETSSKFKPMNKEAYDECMAVAKKVLLEGFRLDGLTEAMYYHATYVSPGWGKEKVAKIGNHIFYK